MAGLNLLAAIVIYWNAAHLGAAVRQRKHAGLEEDPATTFTTAEARDWIGRAEMSIVEFRSVEPGRRRAFAFQVLLVRPSEK